MDQASLRDVFAVLGRAEAEGIVGRYALVGAVAALFYAEATRTFDLDVAVTLPAPSGALLSLSSLYTWLGERGFLPEGEHVRIHDVPVQFLPGDSPLWAEALREARLFDYEGTAVRVASPEHLIAMICEAPTARRRERAALLLESGAVDRAKLREIVTRHGLALPATLDA
jgi:hypothetical protein